jgi:small subunit ribosomal protein S1
MSNQPQHSWNESNIVDDVAFQQQDAELFKNLLNAPVHPTKEAAPTPISGTILKGRIVEITKDHVVIDVGLKSEGLVPMQEFSDPSVIVLDGEVEVLLDQPEDDNGQIVLSREKAERLRQWEYILEHCEEGSIVKGRVLRKVKGGLMVDIGMEAFLPGSQIDNKRIKNLDEYIDKTYEFKILKINIDRKNVVVSRRELLEAERMSKMAVVLE